MRCNTQCPAEKVQTCTLSNSSHYQAYNTGKLRGYTMRRGIVTAHHL